MMMTMTATMAMMMITTLVQIHWAYLILLKSYLVDLEPCTTFYTSSDIQLSPKHNQLPCTETHLSLRVDHFDRKDQDAP